MGKEYNKQDGYLWCLISRLMPLRGYVGNVYSAESNIEMI